MRLRQHLRRSRAQRPFGIDRVPLMRIVDVVAEQVLAIDEEPKGRVGDFRGIDLQLASVMGASRHTIYWDDFQKSRQVDLQCAQATKQLHTQAFRIVQ